jgi:hypothetical protein
LTSGYQNVIIGNGTGANDVNFTTGFNCTLIGTLADVHTAAAQNVTAIGYNTSGQGNNTVTLGNADVGDVFMASDSGATVHCGNIKFPASPVASGDANNLDDYQEGLHSYSITGYTSGTWVIRSGYTYLAYVKIGSIVHVQGRWETTSGSGEGSLQMSMPFAASDLGDQSGVSVGTVTINRTGGSAITTQVTPIMWEGTSVVTFQKADENGLSETYVDAAAVDGAIEGQIQITYRTDVA